MLDMTAISLNQLAFLHGLAGLIGGLMVCYIIVSTIR